MEWKEMMGGPEEPGQMVMRDSETWKNLWSKFGVEKAPAVDFEKQMAVAVFLGMKATGGFALEITKIEKKKKKLIIWLKETKPSSGAFVIQAFTSPYHIKIINRCDLPVEFKYQK
ncbi:MAG: protease complex subunit PrcB family protein [Elusimicrobia bacterium]|nr:protease complex subunit PrcB family protein [Elusimicrobiota bacterium]